jgi:hypothetical protein
MIKGLTLHVSLLQKFLHRDCLYYSAYGLQKLNSASEWDCVRSDCHTGWYPELLSEKDTILH